MRRHPWPNNRQKNLNSFENGRIRYQSVCCRIMQAYILSTMRTPLECSLFGKAKNHILQNFLLISFTRISSKRDTNKQHIYPIISYKAAFIFVRNKMLHILKRHFIFPEFFISRAKYAKPNKKTNAVHLPISLSSKKLYSHPKADHINFIYRFFIDNKTRRCQLLLPV